jgi:2',3'-cyclic-nucleotide 2'-phosphodiesterase (5'-nucleotidase family)
MVPGNHDASLPDQVLSQILFSGSFEVLGGNLELGKSVFTSPALKLECSGIDVKIIGLGAENYETQVTGRSWTGKDGIEYLKNNPPDLDKKSLNILLTHLGFDRDLVAAQQFTDFNMILGGHTHTLTQKPDVSKGTPIFHPGGYGAYINKIEVTCHDDKECTDGKPDSADRFTITGGPVSTASLEVKSTDIKQLRNLFRKGSNRVSRVYMVIPKPIYEAKFRPNFFGTLTVHAMQSAAGAQGAFLNATALNPGFTDKYLKNTDLESLFSFNDKIHTLEMSLEDFRLIDRIMHEDHYYFLHKSFDEDLFSSLKQPCKTIKVAVTEFLAKGGMHDGTVYSLFKDRKTEDTGLRLTACLKKTFEEKAQWAQKNLTSWLGGNKNFKDY